MVRRVWTDGSLEKAELALWRKAIENSRLPDLLGQRHACHNRELVHELFVQDGWEEIRVQSFKGEVVSSRVPRMVEIPFTMSRKCHQWEEPFGAVAKGLLDPKGCEGCKWVPEAARTHPADMQYMR